MTRLQFEQKFYDICQNYGIVVFFNDPSVDKDNGYAMWNEVHLGVKYSSPLIYQAIAFHELGHAIINLKRSQNVKKYKVNSTWHEEYCAWFFAMLYYEKHFNRPFSKKQGEFVVSCLASHADTTYAFKDIFKEVKEARKKLRKNPYTNILSII